MERENLTEADLYQLKMDLVKRQNDFIDENKIKIEQGIQAGIFKARLDNESIKPKALRLYKWCEHGTPKEMHLELKIKALRRHFKKALKIAINRKISEKEYKEIVKMRYVMDELTSVNIKDYKDAISDLIRSI